MTVDVEKVQGDVMVAIYVTTPQGKVFKVRFTANERSIGDLLPKFAAQVEQAIKEMY